VNQVLVQQAVIKMRREIKKFYLKEVNDILSNETSTTNDFLGRTTVSKNIKKSSTIAGNLEKINYIGTITTNEDNVIFTRTLKPDSGFCYAREPEIEFDGDNAQFFLIEQTQDVQVKGYVGVYSGSGLVAGNKAVVTSTEGIFPGMIVSTLDGTTLADSNFVRVNSVDTKTTLTLSSSSFTVPVDTQLLFKHAVNDGRVFLKNYKVIYRGNKGTVNFDKDTIRFNRSVADLPGAAKTIRSISMDTTELNSSSASRQFSVVGDPGAIFDLVVTKLGELTGSSSVTDKTYDFTSDTFTASATKLDDITIGSTGVYTDDVTFETVTSDDDYQFTITAGTNTTLDSTFFGSTPSTPTFTITQRGPHTLTFTLASSSHSGNYVNHGSFGLDVTKTADQGSSVQTFTLIFPISTNDTAGAPFIRRQPIKSDFTNISANSNNINVTNLSVAYGHEQPGEPEGDGTTTVTTNETSSSTSATLTAVSGSSLNGLVASSDTSEFPDANVSSRVVAGFEIGENLGEDEAEAETDGLFLTDINRSSGAAVFNTAVSFGGQEIIFNTSQKVTITATIQILSVGSADTTITLNLDNILDF